MSVEALKRVDPPSIRLCSPFKQCGHHGLPVEGRLNGQAQWRHAVLIDHVGVGSGCKQRSNRLGVAVKHGGEECRPPPILTAVVWPSSEANQCLDDRRITSPGRAHEQRHPAYRQLGQQ